MDAGVKEDLTVSPKGVAGFPAWEAVEDLILVVFFVLFPLEISWVSTSITMSSNWWCLQVGQGPVCGVTVGGCTWVRLQNSVGCGSYDLSDSGCCC